jgi:SET and MYND domain-containing protein
MMAETDPNRFDSLLALADNPSVYETASLPAHVEAYLHLQCLLPPALLPHSRADVSHELISRASHNAFSIRPSSDGEQSGEFLGYGVWPEASFFNHSCRPNLVKERNGRRWSFHTSRDISAGEELFITYLGGDERDLDVKGRRKRLRDEWGFICQCEGCEEEDKVEASYI